MPDEHAKRYQPSSMARFLACPGSARVNEAWREKFGSESSPFAEEGTKAHELAEYKLKRLAGYGDRDYAQLIESYDADPEMQEATDAYVEEIEARLRDLRAEDKEALLLVEQRLDMSPWAPGCFGTGDAVLIGGRSLQVCDLKYGKGVPVSAVGNAQARTYALGAINLFGALYEFETVTTVIIQPRLDSITEETLTVDELLEWGDELREVVDKAEAGEVEFHCGDHCRFCLARAVCAERAATALRMFDSGLAAGPTIPDESIPGILKVLDTAEDWIKDVRAYALSRAVDGMEWSGYYLTRGRRPNRKWTDEAAAVDTLQKAGLPYARYTKTELLGPGAIEKLLGKKEFERLLGGCVSQGEGKLELVPESSGKPRYSAADAAFGDIGTADSNM